jgi:hypothetical protein
MSEPTFLSEEKICFGDLEIMLLHSSNTPDHTHHDDDTFYMAKSISYVESYRSIRTQLGGSAENILEVGIFRGGSAPFLHRFFDAHRIVCVDLMPSAPMPLEKYKSSLPTDILRTHYRINQADREAMTRVLEEGFSVPIDLVVDDASHFYEETKATFEIAFPYVRPGGYYVIEDWDWSHSDAAQQTDHIWAHKSSLTNLIFELIVILGPGTGVIKQVGFSAGMAWVERGWKALEKGNFRLADHLRLRGRAMSML